MLAFLLSTLAIAVSEMGDKTQFIALCLVSRYQRPAPILLGILAATLASNLAAGFLGESLTIWLHGNMLHIILAISFLATAIWAMIPEKEVVECALTAPHGIFFASFWGFLLAEMGDKTQVAAVTFAAHFHEVVAVVLGATLGIMLANIPVVLAGQKILTRIPLKTLRLATGVLFFSLGLYELLLLAA